MSYVQGTTVRLQADFANPETGAPVMPDNVVLTVVPPPGVGAEFERSLALAEIVADPDRAGRFYYLLDTEPGPGTWRYQFEAVGSESIVARKALTVSARL